MTSFLALDLDSATDDGATIYRLSIVECSPEGHVQKRFNKFINPEAPTGKIPFKYIQTDQARLNRAPCFPAVAEEIRLLLQNRIVVTFFPFRINCLFSAFERYRLKGPALLTTNVARMAENVWRISPYDEKKIVSLLRIDNYSTWNCLSRARAHAIFAHCALRDMGITMEQWLDGEIPERPPITPTPYRPPSPPKRNWERIMRSLFKL